MPNDYSNFSQPDSGAQSAPGAGQQAPKDARWDPVQQRWVGTISGGAPIDAPPPRPVGSTWDMEQKGFVPAQTGHSGSTVGLDGKSIDNHGGPGEEGRVTSFGNGTSGADWGGYSGTMVRNPDGSLTYDPNMSGKQADMDRLQGLGAAAGYRDAHQIDYGNANQSAANGQQARDGQQDANSIAANVANGGWTQSRGLAWDMLRQGQQAQQAAAASTRGGSLARASAARNQQNGQAAYMQAGANNVQALKADEMAAGRAQLMQGTTAMRGLDATAQGLNNQQTINQMGVELDQRGLNQKTQMGYEEMAQNVNKAAGSAQIGGQEINAGIDAAASARNSASADRDLKMTGNLIGSGGTAVTGLADAYEKRKKAGQ